MSHPPAPKLTGWAALIATLERGVLLLLSLAVGLVDLLIALFVAAHLGIIPRRTFNAAMSDARRAPLVGPLLTRPTTPARRVKRPAAPRPPARR